MNPRHWLDFPQDAEKGKGARDWNEQYQQTPTAPDHPDPGFGGVCPRREGSSRCAICDLCLDHCKCRKR